MKDKLSYIAFWNSLNALQAAGSGMALKHSRLPDDAGVYEHIEGMALYSLDEAYRYMLSRVWDRLKPLFCAVMLNPSTATELKLDPTVNRVYTRVRDHLEGYGGLIVLNAFAYRATDPIDMKRFIDPVGPGNDWVIDSLLPHMKTVMCGWGTDGEHRGRGKIVVGRMRRAGITPVTLGLTKDGHPKHPLYLSYKTQLREWAA